MAYLTAEDLLPGVDLSSLCTIDRCRHSFPVMMGGFNLEDFDGAVTIRLLVDELLTVNPGIGVADLMDLNVEYDEDSLTLNFYKHIPEDDIEFELRLLAALAHVEAGRVVEAPSTSADDRDAMAEIASKVLNGQGTADDRRLLINQLLMTPTVD